MSHRPWTQREVDRLARLKECKIPIAEIANLLDRSQRAIASAMARYKINPRTSRTRSSVRDYASESLILELRRRGYSVSDAPTRPPRTTPDPPKPSAETSWPTGEHLSGTHVV